MACFTITSFVYSSCISVRVQCRLVVVLNRAPVVITLVILGGLYGTALASACICIWYPRLIASSAGRFLRPRLVIRPPPPRYPRPPRPPLRYYPFYGSPGQPPTFHSRVWVTTSSPATRSVTFLSMSEQNTPVSDDLNRLSLQKLIERSIYHHAWPASSAKRRRFPAPNAALLRRYVQVQHSIHNHGFNPVITTFTST